MRNYLLHELPVTVGNRLLSVDGEPGHAAAKAARVDALLEQQPWEVALGVRSAAVAAVPTLRELIGNFDDWPFEDDRLDAETWLCAQGEDVRWGEIARSSGHFELFLAQATPGRKPSPEPYDLAHGLTPSELLSAWENIVGRQTLI